MTKRNNYFTTNNAQGTLMKRIKRALSLILVLALTFSIILAENPLIANAKAKIRLNKKKITLTVGKKTKLKLKNNKKKVKWSSSKKKVATVNKKGIVTAKKKGTTTITAKAGKKKYTCRVTVKAPKKQLPGTPQVPNTPIPTSPPQIPDVNPSGSPQVPNTPIPTSMPQIPNTPIPTSTPKIPDVNPSGTPQIPNTPIPTSMPQIPNTPIPTSTPQIPIEEIPKFVAFKTYDGKEITTAEAKSHTLNLFSSSCMKTFAEDFAEEIEKSENNWINKDEMLLLKLSYENKKRDSIIEIVLNDSDYGKKQIYTTAASVNKILSYDTYYNEEKDSYITDVLLQLPKTKSSLERTIEIEETCFLRETIGVKGYADLSAARQTSINLSVSEDPLPSYPVYFNFSANENDGYTLISLSKDFTLPDTLYIPAEYEGKPVNQIGDKAFEKAVVKRIIIPDSIKKIGTYITTNTPNLQEIILKGDAPDLTSGFSEPETCKIIVPENKVPNYISKLKDTNGDNGWAFHYSHEKPIYYSNGEEYLTLQDWVSNNGQVFPKVWISDENEAIATAGTAYRSNITWNEETQSISFQNAAQYNSGMSFNLDSVYGQDVDLSSYHYIKCDFECDNELMIKLMPWNGQGGIWSEYEEGMIQIFEGASYETISPGRRTVYLPFELPESEYISGQYCKDYRAILIAPNTNNGFIKLYSIEFLKEKPEE